MQIGTITPEERANFERFKARKPNFGAGLRTLMAAAIWQHFEDCYDRDLGVRLRAALWLNDEGAAFWAFVGLPADQYDNALAEIVPASLCDLAPQDLTSHLRHVQLEQFRAVRHAQEEQATHEQNNFYARQNLQAPEESDVLGYPYRVSKDGKRIVRIY